jgi:hypothetical protein
MKLPTIRLLRRSTRAPAPTSDEERDSGEEAIETADAYAAAAAGGDKTPRLKTLGL